MRLLFEIEVTFLDEKLEIFLNWTSIRSLENLKLLIQSKTKLKFSNRWEKWNGLSKKILDFWVKMDTKL